MSSALFDCASAGNIHGISTQMPRDKPLNYSPDRAPCCLDRYAEIFINNNTDPVKASNTSADASTTFSGLKEKANDTGPNRTTR